RLPSVSPLCVIEARVAETATEEEAVACVEGFEIPRGVDLKIGAVTVKIRRIVIRKVSIGGGSWRQGERRFEAAHEGSSSLRAASALRSFCKATSRGMAASLKRWRCSSCRRKSSSFFKAASRALLAASICLFRYPNDRHSFPPPLTRF